MGEILDGAIKAIRFNPQVMFGLSAIAVAISVIFATLISTYASGFIISAFSSSNEASSDYLYGNETDSMMTMLLSQYGIAIITLFVTPLLTGLLIVSVSRAVIGQKVPIGEVLRSRRIWWVFGFTALTGFAGIIILGVIVAGAALLISASGWAGGIFIVIAGLALLISSPWLTIRTLLVAPALMLEGGKFWATVTRAWKLTRGSFWRLLGIYILVQIIVSILLSILATPGSFIGSALAANNVIWASMLINGISYTVIYTVSTTFSAAIIALLYIDIRMRREGLDLELSRAAA